MKRVVRILAVVGIFGVFTSFTAAPKQVAVQQQSPAQGAHQTALK